MPKQKKLPQIRMKKVPLDQQIIQDALPRSSGRNKRKDRDEDDGDRMLDERMTKKILEGAKKQQQELAEELGISSPAAPEETEDHEEEEGTAVVSGNDEDGQQMMEELKIDEEDEAALNMFIKEPAAKKVNLGEWIAEKIRQKEMQINDHLSETASISRVQKLDPKVVGLYRGVGQVLSRYRSGKVPKPFKVIPVLNNWEQVLYLTRPDEWTAAAMFQATKIFASNLNEKMAQRFFNLILLPRVRDDIATFKKLNYHLYQALRKALFKPGAFFKGIVLPLVEDGDCTLREAVIISSVISRYSIPMLHSAAALLKIAEMEYSGCSSVFLHALLNKKYALPYRVLDALVFHLIRFESVKKHLPVLWHQTLLVFVQNYAADLGSEQRDALLSLIKVQYHHKMTDVIRKVLVTTKPRDVEEGDFVPQE